MSLVTRRHSPRTLTKVCAAMLALLGACKAQEKSPPGDGTTGDIDVDTGSSTALTTEGTESSSPESSTSDVDTSSSHEASTQSDDETIDDLTLKFDLLIPDLDDQVQTGCKKVDFIFVVDNSGSMADEQANLTKSFPGFIEGIRDTLMIDDFQILVIDTDATQATGSSTCINKTCTCTVAPDCCGAVCERYPDGTCNGDDCSTINTQLNCETALGSGRVTDGDGMDCGLDGDKRYILPNNPDIPGAFECLGRVGVGGDSREQVMGATTRALSEMMTGKDGCNEGFIREDAVLVLTFITDEEEKNDEVSSAGTPAQWYADVIAAKGGDKDVVVTVGFIGDHGSAMPVCSLPDEMGNGAEESPRLREFIALFGDNGLEASVCAPDYGPAFTAAISKIDTACQEIDPL